MKELALQKKAHNTLGSELIGFVRKEAELCKEEQNGVRQLSRKLTMETSAKLSVKSNQLSMEHNSINVAVGSVLDLIHIEPGLSKNVKDFLGTVQTVMTSQKQEVELAKIRLQDEIRDQVSQYQK